MDVTPYLKLMVDREASDLFFYVGAPVNIKIEGTVMPLGNVPLKPGAVREIAYSLMTDSQIREFERDLESNFALSVSEIGRFRANVFRQRGEVSMVIRYIKHFDNSGGTDVSFCHACIKAVTAKIIKSVHIQLTAYELM